MLSFLKSVALGSVIVLCISGYAAAQSAPPVAAASDLKFALDAIASHFKSATGRELKLTYGSSGVLAQQIRQSAPFEMFLCADENIVFQLADAGMTVDRGALYAEGRVVLFTPHGSALKPDAAFVDLKTALNEGRVQKFAIANPEHAPYGLAAEQALKSQGLWDAIRSRLVLGENVSQAAQFASSGSTQGGIFAYSLALSPEVAKLGNFVLIPAEWHKPLRQRMVLMKNAGETAKAFYAYMQTPPARTVLRKFGFVLPGEAS